MDAYFFSLISAAIAVLAAYLVLWIPRIRQWRRDARLFALRKRVHAARTAAHGDQAQRSSVPSMTAEILLFCLENGLPVTTSLKAELERIKYAAVNPRSNKEPLRLARLDVAAVADEQEIDFALFDLTAEGGLLTGALMPDRTPPLPEVPPAEESPPPKPASLSQAFRASADPLVRQSIPDSAETDRALDLMISS